MWTAKREIRMKFLDIYMGISDLKYTHFVGFIDNGEIAKKKNKR